MGDGGGGEQKEGWHQGASEERERRAWRGVGGTLRRGRYIRYKYPPAGRWHASVWLLSKLAAHGEAVVEAPCRQLLRWAWAGLAMGLQALGTTGTGSDGGERLHPSIHTLRPPSLVALLSRALVGRRD